MSTATIPQSQVNEQSRTAVIAAGVAAVLAAAVLSVSLPTSGGASEPDGSSERSRGNGTVWTLDGVPLPPESPEDGPAQPSTPAPLGGPGKPFIE